MAKTVRLLNINEIQNSSGQLIHNIPNIADGHSKSADHGYTTCTWNKHLSYYSNGVPNSTMKISFANLNSNANLGQFNGIHKVRAAVSGSDGSQMLLVGGIKDSTQGRLSIDGPYAGSNYSGAPNYGQPYNGNASVDFAKFQYSSQSSSVSSNVLDEGVVITYDNPKCSNGTHLMSPEGNFPSDVNSHNGGTPWHLNGLTWRMYVRRSFSDPATKNTSWGSPYILRYQVSTSSNGEYLLSGGGTNPSNTSSGGVSEVEKKTFSSNSSAFNWKWVGSINGSWGSDGYNAYFLVAESYTPLYKVSFTDNSIIQSRVHSGDHMMGTRGCTDGTKGVAIGGRHSTGEFPYRVTVQLDSGSHDYRSIGNKFYGSIHSGTA